MDGTHSCGVSEFSPSLILEIEARRSKLACWCWCLRCDAMRSAAKTGDFQPEITDRSCTPQQESFRVLKLQQAESWKWPSQTLIRTV